MRKTRLLMLTVLTLTILVAGNAFAAYQAETTSINKTTGTNSTILTDAPSIDLTLQSNTTTPLAGTGFDTSPAITMDNDAGAAPTAAASAQAADSFTGAKNEAPATNAVKIVSQPADPTTDTTAFITEKHRHGTY